MVGEKPPSRDQTLIQGQLKGSETPNRGQSGSARRKIVAQQSIQHMKKQIGQKDGTGTPKSRNNQM